MYINNSTNTILSKNNSIMRINFTFSCSPLIFVSYCCFIAVLIIQYF